MKILCAEYNSQGEVVVIPIGDNALLRNNDDFYIPEFATELSCIPQLVVRISRLGKSVGERFADRYFEEVGVGLRFYADHFEQELRTKNLPVGIASAFDNSAAISQLVDKATNGGMSFDFRVNGEQMLVSDMKGLPVEIGKLIAIASDFHTLKIGDFLFCGNLFRYRGLKLNDRLQMSLNGIGLVDFKLK